MGENTLGLTLALMEEDLSALSASSSTFLDHFGVNGVVLTSHVRYPTLIALLLTSCIFIILVKSKFFVGETWRLFCWNSVVRFASWEPFWDLCYWQGIGDEYI
jgi:hypothetical protein